ncbi:MAG: 2-amino-4-hydroxy-6-hydroxymethyldihydropteridine diphosphokinase [Flavobacteriaceae bacterium]|nr:2-amino-4-hydroxy-6-hydroxymethyldihydropteridine diphosphokinase [Flavobacteriaceae bacterium]
MHTAFLLLGSNQGDRKAFLDQAIYSISRNLGEIVTLSSHFFSKSWGYNDEDYVNQAVKIETFFSPNALLTETQAIEKALGRTTKTTDHYESRPIDIDILFYDSLILDAENLTIPHPRLHLRNFVLEPMKEIAPNLIHPIFKKSIKELAEICEDTGVVWQ